MRQRRQGYASCGQSPWRSDRYRREAEQDRLRPAVSFSRPCSFKSPLAETRAAGHALYEAAQEVVGESLEETWRMLEEQSVGMLGEIEGSAADAPKECHGGGVESEVAASERALQAGRVRKIKL